MDYLDIAPIDAHIHVIANGDNSCRPSLKRHEEIVQEIFDKTGDEAIVLLAEWYDNFEAFGKAGKIAYLDTPLGFYLKHKCPRKIYLFASLSRYIKTPDKNTQEFYLEQIKFRHAAGCDGVKSLDGHLDNYRKLDRISDPSRDLYFEYLEKNKLPITIHVGNPMEVYEKGSVMYKDDPDLPTPKEFYRDVTELLTKFPKLTLILPHFNFMSRDLDKAEYMLSRWENLYFDLTPNIFMYHDFNKHPDEVVRGFFERNCHKILYGTDTFIEEGIREIPLQVEVVRDYFEKEHSDFLASMGIRTLPLSQNILQKMYRDNILKLLGPEPRPVSPAHVIEECQRLFEYKQYLNDNDIVLLNDMIHYFKNC